MIKNIKVRKIDEKHLETLLKNNIKKKSEATVEAPADNCAYTETVDKDVTQEKSENIVYADASPNEKTGHVNYYQKVADDVIINQDCEVSVMICWMSAMPRYASILTESRKH